jgi:hypothetical protein
MNAFDQLERQLLTGVERRRPARPLMTRAEMAVASALRSPRRRLLSIAVAAAAGVVTVLVVGTGGAGPANAFAGWTASPTAPPSGQLQAAEAACAKQNAAVASLAPTVADGRGPNSLLVFAHGDTATVCITGQPELGTVAVSQSIAAAPTASTAVQPESLGLEFAADGQGFRQMAGQVGPGVTAVAVVLEDGTTVRATVANGWFAAWWPGSLAVTGIGSTADRGPTSPLARSLSTSIPRSFEVTTASGTTAQPLNLAEVQHAVAPGAPIGATGASGAAGVGSALAASFAVLRQPGPSPVPLPAGIAGAYSGRAQPPNPYGIDPNLARYAAAASTWILPGSSGACLIALGVAGHGVSSGVCNSAQAALSGELVVRTGSSRGAVNTLVGLAPDGNATVTITDADGSTRQVPVSDNVYKVTGGHPSAIIEHDSSGAITTLPLSN